MRKRRYEIWNTEDETKKIVKTTDINKYLSGQALYLASKLGMGESFWSANKRIKCVQ